MGFHIALEDDEGNALKRGGGYEEEGERDYQLMASVEGSLL